jgi:hypothetical protein
MKPLPPFSSSKLQAGKSKSFLEKFSQLFYQEEISSFVEKFVISHTFHNPIASWLDFSLFNISNDLIYMIQTFSDHKQKFHNHIMLRLPILIVLILERCMREVQPCNKELSWYHWKYHFT